MSALLKLLFCILVFIPFAGAQAPAPTQVIVAPSATPTERPVEQTAPQEKLSFEENFGRGTKAYQEKKFPEAIAYFQKALDLHPDNATVLTNLGLSYFQNHQKGLAIAMLRRALYEDPTLSVAEAGLTFTVSQLEIKEIPHQIETYERLRSSVLNSATLAGFNLITALMLFSSGFIWLKFFGRRRKAFELEVAPPAAPLIGILLAIGFLVAFSFTLLKMYDLSVPRATIIADKVSAQTAPGDGQTGLFDLYAGFEVIVRNAASDWIQISYPGGLTGWVKKESLMATSGKNAF
ncbi:MAG: tetratricopeptide repeat protein [Bdellovibrionaceae bacterium]|nr:tetratricopeptide repeat protein [Pseudobdellovibrionaceae bacterium]